MVITGTRRQCPPVCGDLSSIALAIRRIKDWSNSSRPSISRLRVRATAACEAREAARLSAVGENACTRPVAGSMALSSCSTPMIFASWSCIGTARNDCER
jgi:hypothetical protein